MSAEHVINEHQRSAFERAGDLADPEKFYPMDAFRHQYAYQSEAVESRNQVREDRLKAAKESGLYDQIKREGVREPVELGRGPMYDRNKVPNMEALEGWTEMKTTRGVVEDGHKRIYVQADIDPDAPIPVKWNE